MPKLLDLDGWLTSLDGHRLQYINLTAEVILEGQVPFTFRSFRLENSWQILRPKS